MIQRIQSAWLCLAGIFAGMTFVKPFYMGSELGQMPSFFDASSSIYVMIMTIIVAVFSFFLILLYKNRKLQLTLAILDFILSILLIGSYFMATKNMIGSIVIQSIFTFAIPIFLVLAIRGIWKDIRLVKSVDRLRD